MPSASRCILESTSTASVPRCRTAGATAPALAPGSGTISARTWSTRRSSCSARPRAIFVDLAAQRDGATTDDRFHALLRYDRLRVMLHATTLAAAETPRFVLHGTRGSWVKYGTDPQEAALKAGGVPGSPGWGHDPRQGILTTAAGSVTVPDLPATTRHTTSPSATPSAALAPTR